MAQVKALEDYVNRLTGAWMRAPALADADRKYASASRIMRMWLSLSKAV